MVPIHTCMVPTIKTIRELSMNHLLAEPQIRKILLVSYFLVALLTHVPVEKETVSNNSQGLTWLSDDVPEEAFVYAANIHSVSAIQPD